MVTLTQNIKAECKFCQSQNCFEMIPQIPGKGNFRKGPYVKHIYFDIGLFGPGESKIGGPNFFCDRRPGHAYF